MAKLPVSRADEKARIERLARWLDARFTIPGTGIRFGLDSLVGLVPGVGDLAMFAPALWIIIRAVALGAPAHLIVRMAINTGLDLVIGAIPVLGDLFDLGFKANLRNARLLSRWLDRSDDGQT
tara:strand:- start:615 stop:983 length:369 start_codon:yes stop_codon:yes gene_type:complete